MQTLPDAIMLNNMCAHCTQMERLLVHMSEGRWAKYGKNIVNIFIETSAVVNLTSLPLNMYVCMNIYFIFNSLIPYFSDTQLRDMLNYVFQLFCITSHLLRFPPPTDTSVWVSR